LLVRDKDQQIYAELVRRYEDKLLRYGIYLIGDRHGAADVVQQAFIKAFVNLKGFNVKRKFSSWIYRIVHNEAINYIKKNKKTVSLESKKGLLESLSNNEDIEADFEKKEVQKKVRKCLKDLPIKYREPLVLHFLEDRSYEEISDILRMPMGTVGTRISRGKEKIKLRIKEQREKLQSKI